MEELQELVQARTQAVATQSALKNQRAAAGSAFLKRQFARRLLRLKKDIAAIEARCLLLIRSDPALLRRHTILSSMPGIGPRIAATIIATMRELGGLQTKQAAALAGLAPVPHESGQHIGKRRVRGGRPILRRMLYLAALSAARYNPGLRSFYRRLTAIKPPKVALIAVARKLITLANSLIAQDRCWCPIPPQ